MNVQITFNQQIDNKCVSVQSTVGDKDEYTVVLVFKKLRAQSKYIPRQHCDFKIREFCEFEIKKKLHLSLSP